MFVLGTLINAGVIVIGGFLETLFGHQLKKSYQNSLVMSLNFRAFYRNSYRYPTVLDKITFKIKFQKA